MSEVEEVRDFACACGERAAAMEELRADVDKRIGAIPGFLMTAVVASLNWDFNAHITGIANDQWSVITAETYSVTYAGSDWADGDPFKTHVQCDRIEDGFALTWKLFAERFPERLHDPEIAEKVEPPREV